MSRRREFNRRSSRTSRARLKEIRQLRDLTIVVSEQVVSFMMDVCDRVLVIDRGRFVHEDTRENIDADQVKRLLAV